MLLEIGKRLLLRRLGDPDEVAAAVLRAARDGRRRLVLTPVGKTSAILSRMAPGLYERLMIRSLRSELDQD